VSDIKKDFRINRRIRASYVMLISSEGKQLGVMPIKEALRRAEEEGMDLVEVAPNQRPPVCKIMDYGKFKYDQRKRSQKSRKKQAQSVTKEIKLSPAIEEHDLQRKVRMAKEFLTTGYKTRFILYFKGREITYAESAKQILQKVTQQLEDVSKTDQPIKMEGKQFTMLLSPK
jgi:translation initiation factor IF-3